MDVNKTWLTIFVEVIAYSKEWRDIRMIHRSPETSFIMDFLISTTDVSYRMAAKTESYRSLTLKVSHYLNCNLWKREGKVRKS